MFIKEVLRNHFSAIILLQILGWESDNHTYYDERDG